MPRRSSDGKPFEFRPGIGGFPALGGIFRAGDPATIPPNKHHLVVNARITPGGMKARPGLALLHSTGVTECITGITSDEVELSTLLLYSGAPEGADLNAMTFRAIWPRGGDLAYSEYVAVAFGAATKTPGERSKVIEPLSPDGGTHTPYGTCYAEPFLLNGRVHQFMVMPKPNAEDGFDPTLALVVMDLPSRTREEASDSQRGVGTAGTGGDPDTLFPFEYPLGSCQVVFYPSNPFAGVEVIDKVFDTLVYARRNDDPTGAGTVGVREVLFFIVSGDAGNLALCQWDGVVQTTIHIEPGLSLGSLPPLLGGQAHGPFLVGSTDGVHGDYAGYLDESGAWVELAAGIQYDFPTGPPEPPPGTVSLVIDHWAAYKQSPSGRAIVFFQGLFKVAYGGNWIDARGAWAFEFNPDDSAIDIPVATFVEPAHDALGFPSTAYSVVSDQYARVEVLNERLAAVGHHTNEALEEEDRVFKAPYGSADPEVSTAFYNTITSATSLPNWQKWLRNVAGRLFCGGGYHDVALELDTHSVFDVTTPFNDEVFRGEILADSLAQPSVSKGCLPTVPSSDEAEGWASSEE